MARRTQSDGEDGKTPEKVTRPPGPRRPTRVSAQAGRQAHQPAGSQTDAEGLETLWKALTQEISVPADALVVGEPVELVAIEAPENPRAGILAVCRRGTERHVISFADLVFSPGSAGARWSEVYRSWLGLPAHSAGQGSPASAKRRHKAQAADLDLSRPLELIVLALKASALRCRLPGTEREVTLRTAVRDEVPGEIITVIPTKQWSCAGHRYLSGKVQGSRLEPGVLGLVPLALRPEGEWDPDEEYWGEEGEPLPGWAKPIIAHGRRPAFELEQVLPGADPDLWDTDPIVEASELRAAGDPGAAWNLLMGLLAQDLRCVDAHAHLGNLEFDHRPKQALRHYQAGAEIGGLSLGPDFRGVLPWGLTDNRPYLRCLHGLGLSLWRMGQLKDAKATFERLLWLNPSDNQGARFNLAEVQAGRPWRAEE